MRFLTVISLDADDYRITNEAAIWRHLGADFVPPPARDEFVRTFGALDNGDPISPRRAVRLASALSAVTYALARTATAEFWGPAADAAVIHQIRDVRQRAYERLMEFGVDALIADLRTFADGARIDDRDIDGITREEWRGGYSLTAEDRAAAEFTIAYDAVLADVYGAGGLPIPGGALG